MLARKISRAKWSVKSYLATAEIGADAVTGCLRTSGDTLSWWRCSDKPEDVAEVALAIASRMNQLEKIDIVLIAEELVESFAECRQTEGDTPIEELRSRHLDVVHLDLERLAAIARVMAPRIRSGPSLFTFTRLDLIMLIRNALKSNRLALDELSEKIREELSKSTS